ncbi:CHAD domain-containing protein [Zunongwangia sp. F363]|uniref:CHAD domain-containing protein n=1 Tax=Autumnicola tepida TaxID=3075595 RepID=A0ABU3C9A3_9FLAO|nr:CHAD domain-containing protein [Zunongwangia sp. F363]MDT0642909.1 CHAD domain-containing protein [Zunongwangia sp. F363]
MDYKLNKPEDLEENISRIASEEIDFCISSIKNSNLHEAVHEIRKSLKKLRALARLFRDELGEKKYKEINIFFRDLGQELSPIRDLTAHMETIGILQERYGDHIYVKFFNSVVQELEKERDELEKKLREKNFFSEYILQQFENAQENFTQWPVKSADLAVVLPGLQLTYERGRDALEDAYAEPDAANFHEWRKRAKYLWHQIQLLEDLWPKFFQTWAEEVHTLANYLGDDHDLMILNEKLKSQDFQLKDEKQMEMLHALIKEYSEYLRAEAELQGGLVYAEKPKAIKKRMLKYIRTNWN